MTSETKTAPTPKERIAQKAQHAIDAKKGRTQDFKKEDWYQSAFARFSVSKSARGEGLSRLMPPKKFG